MSDPGRVFLDTNILIYCADRGDPARQQHCRHLVRTLRSRHRAVISTQVLQEFYVVATRKAGVDPQTAKAMCINLGRMPTITVTPDCGIAPTSTPRPTSTPQPTATPGGPTATPIPPTNTPQPTATPVSSGIP